MTSLALEAASAPVADERHVEGRKRLLEAFPSAHRRKARAATPRVLLAALAALTLAGAAAVLLSARNRPLRYDVLGSASSAAGYVSAPPNAPAVRFSDGSTSSSPPALVFASKKHGRMAREFSSNGDS